MKHPSWRSVVVLITIGVILSATLVDARRSEKRKSGKGKNPHKGIPSSAKGAKL